MIGIENMTEIAERRGPGRPSNAEVAARASVENVQERPPQTRKPFGGMEQKLAYEQRAGFHRHWFNEDRKGGISRVLEAGYTHVKDNEGKIVSRLVGKQENGQPQHAFLMEIPEEWYKEDMAAQAREINEKEKAIKQGTFEGQAGDGRYIPSQGISIKHG